MVWREKEELFDVSLMCEDAMVQVKYAWNNTEYDAAYMI